MAKWTQAMEPELRRVYAAGSSYEFRQGMRALAMVTGSTRRTIRRHAHELGLRRNRDLGMTPADLRIYKTKWQAAKRQRCRDARICTVCLREPALSDCVRCKDCRDGQKAYGAKSRRRKGVPPRQWRTEATKQTRICRVVAVKPPRPAPEEINARNEERYGRMMQLADTLYVLRRRIAS